MSTAEIRELLADEGERRRRLGLSAARRDLGDSGSRASAPRLSEGERKADGGG